MLRGAYGSHIIMKREIFVFLADDGNIKLG